MNNFREDQNNQTNNKAPITRYDLYKDNIGNIYVKPKGVKTLENRLDIVLMNIRNEKMKSIEVYLDIFGFDVDPSKVEEELGVKPEVIQRQEEIPKGKRRPAKENSIAYYSMAPEDDELDSHIANILNRLSISNLIGLSPIGASLSLRAVIRIPEGQASPASALVVNRKTMKTLAQINCDLDLDVYS